MRLCACSGTVQTCVIELRPSDFDNDSKVKFKSLREETEALKKEIESLKSEFKRISSALKSHESSFGGHKPHPDTESTQNMAALHVEQRGLLTSQEMNTTILMQTAKTLNN